jgi:hypothetical protein
MRIIFLNLRIFFLIQTINREPATLYRLENSVLLQEII